MPNQRATGTCLIALWLDAGFLRALDEARAREHADRSTFVRRAIAAELRRQGIPFDEDAVYAPDRAGKRRRLHRAALPPVHAPEGMALNEGPAATAAPLTAARVSYRGRLSSKVLAAAQSTSGAAEATARQPRRSPPSSTTPSPNDK